MTTGREITTQDVLNKEKNGDYFISRENFITLKKLRDTHIQDEDKSVKWNKVFVEEHNAKLKEQERAYKEANGVKYEERYQDSIDALAYEYSLSIEEAKRVYSFLYERHHSYGLHEMFNSADEVVDLITDIKKLHGI